MAPFASILGFAVAALVPPTRNIARDGPGPPGDSTTVIISLVATLGSVALILTFAVWYAVVSTRRRRERFDATRATGIRCSATIADVTPIQAGNHKLSLHVSMPVEPGGTAQGVVAAEAYVTFASDEVKARAVVGATIPVLVSRDAPFTLFVDVPGIETFA